jgi:acyl-CoA reductase-like NAD-dependent aldehyde dehydrogenase
MESASKSLKRVTLELGGNDAAIVTKNVDVATMAPVFAGLVFTHCAQVCLAIKRLYIHESIFEEFRDAMVATVKTFKFGKGVEDATVTHGPVQNEMQYKRVKGYFNDIEKEGWKVAVGGKIDESSPGYFITPTIIDRPKEDSRIVVEEPFGKSNNITVHFGANNYRPHSAHTIVV